MKNLTTFPITIALVVLLGLASFFAPVSPPPVGAQPAALSYSIAPDQDDDVVRVTTDLVVLNVTVLDKDGKFVPGLKRSDFQVIEDGVQQTVGGFTAEETPFAAAILLDISGSMETRLTLGRSAAIRFLEGLREEDVAAVYSFDNRVDQMQDFTPGRDLPARAYGLRSKMLTALNDAVLRAADDLGKRTEKRRAIVVLSDGGENASRASSGKALDHALQAGATIYAVNMSETGPKRDFVGESILKNLADKSGGLYVSSPGGQALRDSFAAIAEELGHQYTLVYRPLNRTRDGKWRTLQIKTDRPNLTVRTRKGYRAPKG
ncbi:MAG: Ca-activated chloride channel [Blastocatellia bacterium]|jgi:Ca-activated chloride channel family protein|nr:Ca-activated chloride channel [Blastocatellia bacterium]